MNSMFRNSLIAGAVAVAAALAASPAVAETTVNIPFNFVASGMNCSAGLYTIRHDDSSSFVSVMRKGSSQTFTWVIGPGAPDPKENKVALKFDEIGNSHVLQSVQYGSLITSRLDKKALENERESSRLSGGR